MKFAFKTGAALLLTLALVVLGLGYWYLATKSPQRSGDIQLSGLVAQVSVRYDERGVPHIKATHESDLYRALGYVHAQDRLFQMEMARRLARGELAEILGPKLVRVDKLFRTLGLRDHAEKVVASMDLNSAAVKAQLAYLDGINQFQASQPAPVEFDLLGISKRPFVLQDTVAVTGYLAYSFAAAFKTEPLLTFVRDELGEDYLRIFDVEWNPLGVLSKTPTASIKNDWPTLNQIAQTSLEALDAAGVPLFEGSNAWVVAGTRTSSGKPVLAGDPHIGFSLPAVWYEAHLSMPGFDLYGNFHVLISSALLGHNQQFGWSMTMLQNDDIDLIAERTNPANPEQVQYQDQWIPLVSKNETINVKGAAPVTLVRQQSPHGPIITSAFRDSLGPAPVAMWWAFLETDYRLINAFYDLNRADTLSKGRHAASEINAPGLNIVWGNAKGDIAWWAAAKLPMRPAGVNPAFILDGASGEADKPGFYRFADNPQEENPARGYILSANQQPTSTSGAPVAGYYNIPDRAQALQDRLANDAILWNPLNIQALQQTTQTAYFWRVLEPLLPVLSDVVRDPLERSVFDSLTLWDGQYSAYNIPPTVFTQFLYELAKATLSDELGDLQFKQLLGTRALDHALPRLAAHEHSPWWDNARTKPIETRKDIVRIAWRATIDHLKQTLGNSPNDWGWGAAHTLTHTHPLATQNRFARVLNAGPFEVPGGREVPNNMASPIGPAPWAVTYGPSTRRVIDFADASKAQGINPVGQSGVPFDKHYTDQAPAYAVGGYLPLHLSEQDVTVFTRSTLTLTPSTR